MPDETILAEHPIRLLAHDAVRLREAAKTIAERNGYIWDRLAPDERAWHYQTVHCVIRDLFCERTQTAPGICELKPIAARPDTDAAKRMAAVINADILDPRD